MVRFKQPSVECVHEPMLLQPIVVEELGPGVRRRRPSLRITCKITARHDTIPKHLSLPGSVRHSVSFPHLDTRTDEYRNMAWVGACTCGLATPQSCSTTPVGGRRGCLLHRSPVLLLNFWGPTSRTALDPASLVSISRRERGREG